jgi:nucleotide-binding universal stress UspA family protein
MSTQFAPAPTRGDSDVQPVTIVVGYDGSDESREAIAVASDRAGRDGTVVAVHVRPSPSRWLDTAHYHHAVERYHRVGSELLATVPAAEPDGPAIETQLVDGAPAEALIREAKLYGAREIVVGARGLGRVRAAFSSVSQEMLREADRPVVVVPRRAVKAARAAA